MHTQLTRRFNRQSLFLAVALSQFGILGVAHAEMPEAPTRVVASAQTAFGTLKHVKAGLLDVAYAEVGPATGPAVILLHGWPYDIDSYAQVAPLLAAKGYRVLIPYARGYGDTRFLADTTLRNGQPAALASDVIDFMDALKIKQAVLGGYDWGARSADIVSALWPERVKALVSVSGYLIGNQAAGKNPLPPKAELQWWYQFYFATERGAAGYQKNTHDFAKLIWQLASPQWKFDDATFDRSAKGLENPDHVAITVFNYRWRLGLVQGETKYDPLEQKLAQAPSIGVPTITLEGDANGAPHPQPEDYAKRFTGKYEFRLINGGVGHNLPQEAPEAFAKAVIDADHL
ncbi:alpha/beta fold hydrolase [Pseudomonas reactans]|uniref:Alpha/beta hydrolase n=1 Tax=Pseudomonas reactans TaxID=117680 RepID=A0ABX2QX08_9PSED|nr:alpha/beta hydrolase [Pseudomonas reactans]NWA43458.1 alpha/beta hydrolase [Pseudomonas reactans]NWC88410.1 alpha/beta hydrolase [Pseudomonas reactans]NWD30289.1 alpha/beta hydrolase [Pseudomonas reactans]NWD96354.1 alpha/beta hydrolase [Pseudomonas reactans]NWF12527.1 alpha/beta hydrolase [Pseudomonas reactans]